jgi:hypothetical protein
MDANRIHRLSILPLNCFISMNSRRVRKLLSCKSNHAIISLVRLGSLYQLKVIEILSWNWHGRFQNLQESGEYLPELFVFKAPFYTFIFVYEFTIQVSIKIFNDVISTKDDMSYFLFFPPRFLGKYTQNLLFSKLYEFFHFTRLFSY